MHDGYGEAEMRAETLAAYDIVDTPPERQYDDIVAFAARLCDAPIALISIVEENRQWFKARVGLDAPETSREISFCAHAMRESDVMVVPDATRDPRFADNPLVTGPPFIRFYAGAPLVASDGVPLGSLCIIDTAPRDGLTDLQHEGLRLLAGQVMAQMELKRSDRARRIGDEEAQRSLAESEGRFRILADTMPQMVWSTLPDGAHDYYNARWYEFTGVPEGSTDGEGWNDVFHPDDQAHAWARWRHSLTTGEPYEIEYRLRHHSGQYRWTLGRALPIRDNEGRITRWFGTCTDIHEQKLLMEQREVIAHELSHRIKNIFSVISGLMGLSARANPTLSAPIAELRDRVMALGRAHDFVRPHSAASRSTVRHTSLQGLLDQLFAPYRDAGGAPRIRIGGADPDIDDRAATPLALAFHELATNAAKYGALSVAGGHVDLSVDERPDHCVMDWREQGGPALAGAPKAPGFGTSLLSLSMERQLGGSVALDWPEGGLHARFVIPRSAMSRTPERQAAE